MERQSVAVAARSAQESNHEQAATPPPSPGIKMPYNGLLSCVDKHPAKNSADAERFRILSIHRYFPARVPCVVQYRESGLGSGYGEGGRSCCAVKVSARHDVATLWPLSGQSFDGQCVG